MQSSARRRRGRHYSPRRRGSPAARWSRGTHRRRACRRQVSCSPHASMPCRCASSGGSSRRARGAPVASAANARTRRSRSSSAAASSPTDDVLRGLRGDERRRRRAELKLFSLDLFDVAGGPPRRRDYRGCSSTAAYGETRGGQRRGSSKLWDMTAAGGGWRSAAGIRRRCPTELAALLRVAMSALDQVERPPTHLAYVAAGRRVASSTLHAVPRRLRASPPRGRTGRPHEHQGSGRQVGADWSGRRSGEARRARGGAPERRARWRA